MPNRSQEENMSLLLEALRRAGQVGLTVDEARQALFGGDAQSKSMTKKMLDHLKAKGLIKIKVDKMDVRYLMTPGR